MTDLRHINRRNFLKTTGLGTAAPLLLPSHVWAAASTAKPNARIVMGFIGVGTQGRGLLNGFLHNEEVQVVAICDVDTTRREYSLQKVQEYYSQKTGQAYKGATGYKDFRELLQRGDLTAVCIATPDHWHAIPVILACERKLDIYCEKPLSLTLAEARAMANAVRRHDRVCQTGSMQRSSSEFLRACELVRNGAIGRVKEVYVNVGGPSQWCDLKEEEMEPGLDWNFWLGQAPMRPYNSVLSPRRDPDAKKVVHQHFPAWRNYREYSGGGMTDWGAHHFDIAQWGLGMDESGPVEIIPPDGKEVKKLTFKYANGVVMYHGALAGYSEFGTVWVGETGKVCVNRGKFKTEPEALGAEYKAGSLPIQLYKSGNQLGDFLKCVRSRQRPICDVEVGARSVTVCHLANLAYWNKRALKWDPKTERFVGDNEANQWRDRARRAPWQGYIGDYWKT